MSNDSVAIIGCGLVGRCWAIVFGRAGCRVSMYDADPKSCSQTLSLLSAMLPLLHKNNALGGMTPERFLSHITVSSSIEAVLETASHVQECIPEDILLKKKIFGVLDKMAKPGVCLASSTSNLTCSSWSSELVRCKSQCLVAHPINPPHCIPLVEIVPAPWTDPAIVTQTLALMKRVGQVPVLLKKEVPGFAVNRLQYALLEEAYSLVERGIMSPQDVDSVVRDGLGMRWSFLGPFQTIDLNAPEGVAQYEEFYGKGMRDVLKDMAGTRQDWTVKGAISEINTALRAQYPVSGIAAQRTSRDNKLMALRQHKEATSKL